MLTTCLSRPKMTSPASDQHTQVSPYTFYMNNYYGILLSMVLVLGLISASPISRCPSKCNCAESTIKCVDKRLSVIPDFKEVDQSLTILDLSGNDIEEVSTTNFFFTKLTTVQYLHLNDNSIMDIEATAFSALTKLEYLDLSNNLLSNIPCDVIQTNRDLEELNLSGNLFSSETPELISTSLKILDLSFSKISAFTEKSLQSLPQLRVLYLHANSLKQVDSNIFFDVVPLQYVDLSFNCWKCHCDTIKLFDQLVHAGLTEIDRPIQCMHSNKWYEDIYSSKGPMHHDKLCKKRRSHPHPHKDETIEDFPKDLSMKNEVLEHNNFPLEKAPKNSESGETVFYLRWEIWVGTAFGMFLIGCVLTIFTKFVMNKYKKTEYHTYAELFDGRTSSITPIAHVS